MNKMREQLKREREMKSELLEALAALVGCIVRANGQREIEELEKARTVIAKARHSEQRSTASDGPEDERDKQSK